MQLTKMKKRAALTGTGLFAASLSVIPFAAPSASAAAPLVVGENAAVSAQTDYNCNEHTLTVEVTNKLDKDISPAVEFNKMPEMPPPEPKAMGAAADIDHPPIKPGEKQLYMYNFSGNDKTIPTEVSVDGYDPLKLDPMVSCQEPVSFMVTGHSDFMVTGYLKNNNDTYPQYVTLSTPGQADVNVTLEGSQGGEVAIPIKTVDQQTMVSLTITNGPNYQGRYLVDLEEQLPLPPLAVTED